MPYFFIISKTKKGEESVFRGQDNSLRCFLLFSAEKQLTLIQFCSNCMVAYWRIQNVEICISGGLATTCETYAPYSSSSWLATPSFSLFRSWDILLMGSVESSSKMRSIWFYWGIIQGITYCSKNSYQSSSLVLVRSLENLDFFSTLSFFLFITI